MSKNFTWPATAYLFDDYKILMQCLEKNNSLFKNKEIVIFGSGIRGTIFGQILINNNYNNFVYIDNNIEKHGGFIHSKEHIIYPFGYLIENQESKVVIISIEGISAIKEQLINANYVENTNFFYIDSNVYENYVKEFLRPYNNNTLLISDCFFSHISAKDTKFDSLHKMVKEEFGKENIKVLTLHGMGMRSFYNLIKLQIKLGHIPKRIMLMTNFEIFTKINHLLPRTQHSTVFNLLKEKLDINDGEFYDYIDTVTQRAKEVYTETIKFNDEKSIDSNARLVIKNNYMHNLSEKIENSVYLIEILKYANGLNIEVICFIPPVNYQYARSFYDNFDEKYHANQIKMKDWIENYNFKMLDLSYLLTSDYFADIKNIDETCNYEGRVKVLEQFKKIF